MMTLTSVQALSPAELPAPRTRGGVYPVTQGGQGPLSTATVVPRDRQEGPLSARVSNSNLTRDRGHPGGWLPTSEGPG